MLPWPVPRKRESKGLRSMTCICAKLSPQPVPGRCLAHLVTSLLSPNLQTDGKDAQDTQNHGTQGLGR